MKDLTIKLGIALAAVFAPAKGMLLTALALIIMDLVLGVWASKKQSIPITSAAFGRTVTKLLVYEVAIALAFLAQHYLMNDVIPAASIVASFVGMTELMSCMENLNIIGGGDLLRSILDKLGSQNK